MDMEDPLYIYEKFHINDDGQSDRCKLLAELNHNKLQRDYANSFESLRIIAPDDVINKYRYKIFQAACYIAVKTPRKSFLKIHKHEFYFEDGIFSLKINSSLK